MSLGENILVPDGRALVVFGASVPVPARRQQRLMCALCVGAVL